MGVSVPPQRRRGGRLLRIALGMLVVLAAGAILAPIGAKPSKSITGTSRADLLRGTKGPDRILGLGGNDRLFGYGADDHLVGGRGNDVLVGGPGRDRLFGGPGSDRINARDGSRDYVSCGTGRGTVIADAVDTVAGDCGTIPIPPSPPTGNNVVLTDRSWDCVGPVDLDLVKVTLRTTVDSAVSLDRNCTGRIRRLEIETWTGDGIKVQNRGTVARDFVVESGYIKCHDVYPGYHQDGIQVMGGTRITFRNLRIDCLGNSNLFLSRGGGYSSTPTDVVCDGCVLGPNSGQTLFYATSIRSGARGTTVCTGRFRAIRIEAGAEGRIDENNRTLPHNHPSCRNVTGKGSTP
jgi:hypothetical protein